jgi:hypothetical protein
MVSKFLKNALIHDEAGKPAGAVLRGRPGSVNGAEGIVAGVSAEYIWIFRGFPAEGWPLQEVGNGTR